MHVTRVENSPVVASSLADPAWDEAFLRVESYLRAHHLESRTLLNHAAADIIREARERGGDLPPVAAAMKVAHQRIGAWFWRAGQPGDWSDVRVRQRGRLSLVLGDLPGRWSNHFLSNDPVPPELAAALTSGVLQPGPELRLSNMPPAPLEFGFDDPGDVNSASRSKWMMIREAGVWLTVLGFFGAAWAAAH